jgi:signal transduction histidine kinase
MPPRLASAVATRSTVLHLEDILALHRALVYARARLPDLEAFLDEVLETLCRHLGADGGMIGVCDPVRRRLAHLKTVGTAPPALADENLLLPYAVRQLTDAAEQNAQVFAWAEAATRDSDPQVLAAAALTVRGDVVGVVCLFGAADAERRDWQQDGLAAAALEIGLAVSHLRLRRDVEERLRQRNERWSALYEIAVSLTAVMDSDQLLDELVRRTVRLLHARRGSLSLLEEATSEHVVRIAYSDGVAMESIIGLRLPPGQGLAARVTANRRPLFLPDYTFAGPPGFGALRTSVIAAPLYVQNMPAGVLAIGDDPDARQFTEDDIQTVELLAQTAGAILERIHGRGQEELLTIHRERARLARELHDGLAQNLASMLLKAELCCDLAADASGELQRRLDGLAEGLQQAVRETRAAIASLHEAPSDGERLMDALSLLAARFESQTGVPVALSWEGQAHRSFPAAAHMALLRVAQEALANVRKHACAQRVCAHLNATNPKMVELTVHDDGCGFDAGAIEVEGGLRFGLRGMRGRMQELGGSLRIETAPGCGATVTAMLPLNEPGRR